MSSRRLGKECVLFRRNVAERSSLATAAPALLLVVRCCQHDYTMHNQALLDDRPTRQSFVGEHSEFDLFVHVRGHSRLCAKRAFSAARRLISTLKQPLVSDTCNSTPECAPASTGNLLDSIGGQ